MTPNDEESGQLPAFLMDPGGVLRRRWAWACAVAALGIVATAVVVARTPVTYLASASLLVTEQKIPDSFVPSTVETNPLERVDALVGEILAREQMAALIEKHKLYSEFRARYEMLDLVAIARSNVVIAPGSGAAPKKRGEPVNIYTISFRDGNAKAAADMANDLATLFTAAASRISGQQARLTTDFMRAELERSERELRAQERLVLDFKAQYRGELPSELTPNMSKLERLAAQRDATTAQLTAAETRVADMEALGDMANPSSPFARLSALRARLAQELTVNTDEHPNVLALRRQIASLEQEIAEGGTSSGDPSYDIALRTARQEVASLKALLANIAQEMQLLEERVARTSQREEELTALTQKAAVLQETYVTNLRKLQSAELAQSVESAHQGARVEVLDRAVAPSGPESTRVRSLMLGVAASLAAAVAAALLLELVDPVIVSAKQLERELGIPVLGSVGRLG